MALILVAIVCVPVMLAPQRGTDALNVVLGFLSGRFGWLYLLFGAAVAALLACLGFSRFGRVRFGDAGDRPDYSLMSWLSMIFTAGIGGGIMYWGIIEWAYYYNEPPRQMEPHSVEAAHWAATYPLFHWGPTAWALFCLPALALSYLYHVRKRHTLRLSEACRAVLGDRVDGWPGKVIDVLFVIGVIGAAGTSLGLEVPVVSEGVATIFPVDQGLALDIGVIAVWTILFGASLYFGLQRGLKRLANLNLGLAGFFAVFLIVAGPTVFIVDTMTNSVGLLLNNFVEMSFYTDPVGGSGFEEDWTVFYWGWWISYAPFVGLFVAKISKGRTVRGTIAAMCFGGSLGCWLSFMLMGNTGLFYELRNVLPVAGIVSEQGDTAAIVATLQAMPWGGIALGVFLLLLMVFLATTLDSSAYTMAAAASRDLPREADPPRWHRVFWAVVLSGVSVVLMYAGGLDALQTLSVVTAFPLIFVLALVAVSFWRTLQADERSGVIDTAPQHRAGTESPSTAQGPAADNAVEDGPAAHHPRVTEGAGNAAADRGAGETLDAEDSDVQPSGAGEGTAVR
ncbi:BCCT family transporter [Bounagaea algeriensis]